MCGATCFLKRIGSFTMSRTSPSRSLKMRSAASATVSARARPLRGRPPLCLVLVACYFT